MRDCNGNGNCDHNHDPGPRLTYLQAMAVARDFASARAREQGRREWDDSDWNLAARIFDDLMGEEGRQS